MFVRFPFRASCRIIAIVALAAPLVAGIAWFVVEIGHRQVIRTELQAAADSAALAAARQLGGDSRQAFGAAASAAAMHQVDGQPARVPANDVELGVWDASSRQFTAGAAPANAVCVTAKTGRVNLLTSNVFGARDYIPEARAIAAAAPRDIVFVIGLSGAMNDESEPFGQHGGRIAANALRDIYGDFGFGPPPGELQYVGQGFAGISGDRNAYASLTADAGPLTDPMLDARYRINSGDATNYGDSESVRKEKAYRWIIDHQIAKIMPRVCPSPRNAENFAYWSKYLDYVIEPQMASDATPDSSARRGTIPPSAGSQRIHAFNNRVGPAIDAQVKGIEVSDDRCRRIGYLTYVQFMTDWGRDLKPAPGLHTPLSRYSRDCPTHRETTAAGELDFPPREQPLHAVRRALVAAIASIAQRNQRIRDEASRDRVSIVTYDSPSNGATIAQPLTADYQAAIVAATCLQASGDVGATASCDTGLAAARDHAAPLAYRGAGRGASEQVVVLITNTAPDGCARSAEEVARLAAEYPSAVYLDPRIANHLYQNAALVEAARTRADGLSLFAIGLCRGESDDFVDRVARIVKTADANGRGLRCAGDASDVERQLVEMFEHLLARPRRATIVR